MKNRTLAILFLFNTISIFAQTGNEEKTWIDKGKKLHEDQDYRGSLRAYLKAYKLNAKKEETVTRLHGLTMN